MRSALLVYFSAAAVVALLTFAASPGFSKTAKQCNAEYAARKDDLKAAGTKKADFMATCKAELAAAGGAAAGGKSAKECAAEYSENKVAIEARGEAKKDFIA